MEPLLAAYANPTAHVGAELMAEWDDAILDTQQVVEETSVFEELLVPVEHLQTKIDSATDEEGVIVIGETPVTRPNGVIRLNHVCAGWNQNAEIRDPDVDGTIDLTLTLQGGSLQPVVWGIFEGCRWESPEALLQVEYDGEIQAHFGGSFGTDTALRQRLITFAVSGDAVVGEQIIPVRQSFRVALAGDYGIRDGRLDILIETAEGESFVFFFRAEDFAAGVHDATGRFFCSLEERRCESPSGRFSW
jgi:hypothetical protein